MKRIFFLLLLFLMTQQGHAGGFQDAQNFASQHAQPPVLNGGVSGQNIPGYTTSSPAQTSYQGSPNNLSNASSSAVANDTSGAASFIQNSAASRPQFNITANDPLIQGAQTIQNQAGALSGLNPTNTKGCQSVTVTTPAQYDTYTCTQSNTIVSPVCNQSLTVTATTSNSCTAGASLGTASVSNITGANTAWPGTMSISATCGAAPGFTDIYMHLSNAGGDCDNFKTYRNLGHLNLQITPQTAVGKEKLLGNIYMVKWKAYFYCINPPKVYYTFNGCNNNQCSLDIRVDDGTVTQVCKNGGAIKQARGKRYCLPRTTNSIITVHVDKYATLTWTQNHSVTTFTDTWSNLPCQ